MAHGFATINGEFVLLCEACFDTEDKTDGAIIRKYWNAPDMKFEKGGIYESVDQLRRDIAAAVEERGSKPTN